jgi:5-deoxy-D-glucuronate isomerase
MFRTARIIAAPLAIAAALAGAGTAHASAPVIPSLSTNEAAQALVVPITAKCQGAKRCTYAVETADGTAFTNEDYLTTTTSGTVKKKQTFNTTLVVPIINDLTPEDAETLIVRVVVTRGKNVATFEVPQVIAPSDLPGFPF